MKVPSPRKLSSGNWFIQLRLNGISIPVTASSSKECKDAAALIKAEHKAGKREINVKCNNVTLNKAIDNYIESRSNTLSPATIMGYRTIQRNRFKTTMNRKLKDISNWQKICNDEAKKCSAKTLKNSYYFICSVLRENGITPSKITLPPVMPNEKPWLDPEQITKFIKAVHGQKCEIPALLALSSLRRSEICALEWKKHIDLSKRCVFVKGAVVPNEKHKYIRKSTTKNSTSNRVVPIMIPELQSALDSVENKSGAVINCKPNTIRARINRICKDNGLPEVGVHGLRHSFASLAYHLGMPEKECMKIGGWADSNTMHNIYTHLADADIKKYENIMTEFYNNANKNAYEQSMSTENQTI